MQASLTIYPAASQTGSDTVLVSTAPAAIGAGEHMVRLAVRGAAGEVGFRLTDSERRTLIAFLESIPYASEPSDSTPG